MHTSEPATPPTVPHASHTDKAPVYTEGMLGLFTKTGVAFGLAANKGRKADAKEEVRGGGVRRGRCVRPYQRTQALPSTSHAATGGGRSKNVKVGWYCAGATLSGSEWSSNDEGWGWVPVGRQARGGTAVGCDEGVGWGGEEVLGECIRERGQASRQAKVLRQRQPVTTFRVREEAAAIVAGGKRDGPGGALCGGGGRASHARTRVA